MNKKAISINIFMFILFFLMLLTLGIDYITYFFNTSYIVSFFISLLFNFVLAYFLLKKVKIKKDFSKLDLIFFSVLLLIMAFTIVYPDRAFDTYNYHLYLQENPFGDKIGLDFFAGKNLNSFTYAFPDRLFYIFRYFLGFRLGVLLNYLIIVTVYYQVKEIIKKLLPKSKELFVVIVATLVATSISLIDIIDSYYIDLISLVLLLEIFRLVLCERISDTNNRFLLGYFGLLFGFTFVVKISNAFSLIVFFILFIVINRKSIKKYINIKNILLTFLALFIPFIIYVVYTYLSTGSPVFPFYNTIFKSEYFGDWNWLDTRFGPQRLIDKVLYPYTMYFNEGLTNDVGIIEPIWSIGYFISIFYIIYYAFIKFVKKIKINKDKFIFAISTLLIYLVWINFQLGYTRYGFIALILGSIITYMFIYDLFKRKLYILVLPLCAFVIYNYQYSFDNYGGLKKDWVYNNVFNNPEMSYKYNLKKLFATGYEYTVDFEEGSVWGIISNNSGYAQMINGKVPIINLNDSANGKYAEEKLEERLKDVKHIYTLTDSIDMENFFKRINKAGYKIIKVKDVLSSDIISRKNSFTYIFEIKKEKFNNSFISFEAEKNIITSDKVSFYIGIDRWTNKTYFEDMPVQVIGIKDNDEEVVIDEFKVSYEGRMDKKEYNTSDYKKLKIYAKDTWLTIINIDGGEYE